MGAQRRIWYVHLEPAAWPQTGLSLVNRAVIAGILVSVAAGILHTEPTLAPWGPWFEGLELVLGALFAVEYLARLWVAPENPAYAGRRFARLRYALSPAALLDLVALAAVALTLIGVEGFLLRLVRVLRILRLARLGRFSRALALIGGAVRDRWPELLLSLAVAMGLLVVSSALLYMVEAEGQPEAFGSIPRAMWWSIATLTTVGYGDVYPLTLAGRLFAAVTALTGIGLIAMPTGILAAALSDAMQAQRERGADPVKGGQSERKMEEEGA